MKVCITCNINYTIENFSFRKDNNKYRNECKSCKSIRDKQSYQQNKEQKQEYATLYRKENPELIKLWREKNPEYDIQYRQTNKKRLNEQQKQYNKQKRKTDICFKLRGYVSKTISETLNSNGSSKNNQSITQYLPYTILQLTQSIELMWKSWMTWKNYGRYNSKTWDDNDPNTWTWQLDHIVPQSDLPYSSMTDKNFQKCWGLENLRPLSAKQNILDGTNRIRHKFKGKK